MVHHFVPLFGGATHFDEVSPRCSRVQDEYIIISGDVQGALSNGSCQLRAHNYINCGCGGVQRHNNLRVSVHARVYVRKMHVCVFVCDAVYPDDKSYAPNNDTGESTVTDPLSTM